MMPSPTQRMIIVAFTIFTVALGIGFSFLGQRVWFGPFFALGFVFLWAAVLGFCHIRACSAPQLKWPAVVALTFHVLLFVESLLGIVFILPPTEVSSSQIEMILYGLLCLIGLLGCFAVYFQKSDLVEQARMVRFQFWIVLGVIGALIAQFVFEHAIHVEVALVLFGVSLLVSIEGILSISRSIWIRGLGPHPSIVLLPSLTQRVLFSRLNPAASALDCLERELGIDLKGAWAISVLRRSAEPMLISFLVLLWGTSAFTIVPSTNSGVREWLGSPEKTVLGPGLHLSAPWPFGGIQHVQTERVLSIEIGHEEESEGDEDENILWADQHADSEFTLLLGDGRELISADGVLNFRIDDVHQYLYGHRNSEGLLSALAYRALMRETASRNLNTALSENLDRLATHVLTRIVSDVSAQNLGLKPVSFTFSALHPPVGVAADYQRVVSAEIEKETLLIRAKTAEIRRLPAARAKAKAALNQAKGQAEKRKSEAVGRAEAFLSLKNVARSNQELFVFRKRLEALETHLANKDLMVIDRRIEKDGGEVWVEQ